jgi:hypothetical protein
MRTKNAYFAKFPKTIEKVAVCSTRLIRSMQIAMNERKRSRSSCLINGANPDT